MTSSEREPGLTPHLTPNLTPNLTPLVSAPGSGGEAVVVLSPPGRFVAGFLGEPGLIDVTWMLPDLVAIGLSAPASDLSTGAGPLTVVGSIWFEPDGMEPDVPEAVSAAVPYGLLVGVMSRTAEIIAPDVLIRLAERGAAVQLMAAAAEDAAGEAPGGPSGDIR